MVGGPAAATSAGDAAAAVVATRTTHIWSVPFINSDLCCYCSQSKNLAAGFGMSYSVPSVPSVTIAF
jgi:hypothetical protein